MSDVIEVCFREKNPDIVLTCKHCGCQQFYLRFEPMKGESAQPDVMAAQCAACNVPAHYVTQYNGGIYED